VSRCQPRDAAEHYTDLLATVVIVVEVVVGYVVVTGTLGRHQVN